MRREHLMETVVGAAVLFAAAGFLTYALGAARGAGDRDGYALSARFGQVGGLAPGADVRVAGVKVGSVSTVELEPQTYFAVARLRLHQSVKLPADSTAKISSDGLLGGAHVSVEPGGATELLPPGGEITNTQGAVDIFGMIGGALRPPAAGQTSTPDASTAAAEPE
ncbi:MAG: outer membrane lipid asymmetry maintenance protein MlaD [Proteobacteria bacterium]|nr:outer membrane lipid asymmetry maintenance protein MlaD [Pseudomonadota bacterium]MBW3616211.1 outer membrane lipid asymmetry maintenance protein MlaD [Pseudomonadota bacterium]